MAKRFHIDLAITVGHPAMIATGPTGGIPIETGLVIASLDAIAADCVGARLLGFTASLDDAARAFTQAAYGKAITLKGA